MLLLPAEHPSRAPATIKKDAATLRMESTPETPYGREVQAGADTCRLRIDNTDLLGKTRTLSRHLIATYSAARVAPARRNIAKARRSAIGASGFWRFGGGARKVWPDWPRGKPRQTPASPIHWHAVRLAALLQKPHGIFFGEVYLTLPIAKELRVRVFNFLLSHSAVEQISDAKTRSDSLARGPLERAGMPQGEAWISLS
jgi:hypothetical protein